MSSYIKQKIITMNKNIKVDLPNREELRYLIFNAEQIIAKLAPYVDRKKFSDNEIVQTIYFNNDNHDAPFSLSLKIRQYLPTRTEILKLNKNKYFLDIKKRNSDNRKEKVRLEGNLEELLQIINQEFKYGDSPLRPFIAVEYSRQHYVPKNNENIRITLDSNMKYFYFPFGKEEAVEIGREDNYSRVEIKISQPESEFMNDFNQIIENEKLFPIISKKFMGYFLLKNYQTSLSNNKFAKELKNYEIESKLEAESDRIFPKIKYFCENNLNGFGIPKHFQYVFDSASINRYYQNEEGYFKALLRGDKVKIVRKSPIEIIANNFNLKCVTKRTETKDQEVSLDSDLILSSKLLSELLRTRRAFYLVNNKTGRSYHITIDHCVAEQKSLYQLEVEYTGTYSLITDEQIISNNIEQEIINDIAYVTNELLINFPELKPSILTKQEWSTEIY